VGFVFGADTMNCGSFIIRKLVWYKKWEYLQQIECLKGVDWQWSKRKNATEFSLDIAQDTINLLKSCGGVFEMIRPPKLRNRHNGKLLQRT
jgi:hypothetical protein